MSIKKQFTTVTTLSKILALALFVALPFIGFYVGINYRESVSPVPIIVIEKSSVK